MLGAGKDVLGTLQTHLLERPSQGGVGGVAEQLGHRRKHVGPHADGLAALPRKEKRVAQASPSC
jgi:hypothetical protein